MRSKDKDEKNNGTRGLKKRIFMRGGDTTTEKHEDNAGRREFGLRILEEGPTPASGHENGQ